MLGSISTINFTGKKNDRTKELQAFKRGLEQIGVDTSKVDTGREASIVSQKIRNGDSVPRHNGTSDFQINSSGLGKKASIKEHMLEYNDPTTGESHLICVQYDKGTKTPGACRELSKTEKQIYLDQTV